LTKECLFSPQSLFKKEKIHYLLYLLPLKIHYLSKKKEIHYTYFPLFLHYLSKKEREKGAFVYAYLSKREKVPKKEKDLTFQKESASPVVVRSELPGREGAKKGERPCAFLIEN
jgi:hypothetical protein